MLETARPLRSTLLDPKPDVEILTFNESGPVLAVRPYCNTAHDWQVYFDANRTIRETFGAAAILPPKRLSTFDGKPHERIQGTADSLRHASKNPRRTDGGNPWECLTD